MLSEIINMASSLSFTQRFYIVVLSLGTLMTIINIMFGELTDFFDIDFDIDLDGTAVTDFLPLSGAGIMMFLVTTGAIGLISYKKLGTPLSLVVAIASGLGASILLNKFVIKPLRENKAESNTITQMVGKTGTVAVRIRPGQLGKVVIETKTGILSYTAELFKGDIEEVDEGSEVCVVDIYEQENKLIVVKVPSDKELRAMGRKWLDEMELITSSEPKEPKEPKDDTDKTSDEDKEEKAETST